MDNLRFTAMTIIASSENKRFEPFNGERAYQLGRRGLRMDVPRQKHLVGHEFMKFTLLKLIHRPIAR